MKRHISYKNCLIRSESFQLTQGSWIPRSIVTCDNRVNGRDGNPSRYDRLDKVFWTENEADEFAVQDAMRRIDRN